MDHSLSRSASSSVLTAGHRRPSAESLSERNSPFKDTGQPGAHSHKVLSLTAMNAAKQEAATNGNHSPVMGKPESNPIWNRVNGFQNTPASLALQSKNVPGLCEGRSALNNKPMFNGTPLMAEVESATHPVSLGQCKSDNIEANGRPQSGGSPVVSRAETAPIGLRYPSDAKYTRHDQLIAETGQSVDTNSSGKSDISSQSRANEVISPFLHIPVEGSNSKKCPSVPQSLSGQLGASVSEASQTNNPIELTSSCEVSGDNGVPPLTSPEDSEPKSMKACSVKLVDISGGVKKEPSPPPRAVIDPKIGLPGQNAPSRESLKRESPTNFKRSTCEPVVKKTKDELLPPPPQQQHKQQQQPQPQQPCGPRNSSPNSSRSVPVTNQRDPIPTLTSSSSSSSSQASTLSSPSKEKNQGLDQSYKSKWHLKEDNSLPTSTNNGSPLKTSSSSNTIESKVTISPVRKESKCGLSSSGQPGGSVTITKLSTGSSQRIESKDLKKQNPTDRSTASTTSSTSSSSSHLIASSIPNRPNLENGHHTSGDLNTSSSLNKAPRKSSHSYSVEMQRKKDKKSASVSGTPLSTGSNFPSGVSPSGQPSMAQVKKPRDEVCNSCKVEFSTREALHLHTCNSKLDQHYLTENQVRASEARRGDKSANSSPRNLSRNNSRSNSPVSQHNSSSNSSSNIPSHLQSSSVAKANQRMNSDSEFKLVNNTKDELMIEGRPKITVSKVVGSTKTSGGEDSESRKPIIPKIKLSASVNAKGSSSSNSSPVATPTLLPPQPLSSFSLSSSSASSSPPESRAINSMLDSSPLSSLKRKFGDNSSKLDTPSFNGKIKLKIPGNITNAMSSAISASDSYSAFGSGPGHSAKDAGSTLDSSKVPPSSTRPSESNIGHQYLMSKKKEEEAAGYAFAFAGRPTYSPSRIEPSSSHIPEKESPRDASNKDSPASQADSGVFSIASSNSPSKGESANSGTSPDSPTRYSDVQWKPPGSKTTVTTPTESPNGSGPTQSLASLNSSAPFNQSASNQNSISTNNTFPSSSASMGMAVSSNSNQQMSQTQQHHPHQQQQPHNPYLNMYGDFNSQQQQQSRDPGFNRQSPMYSAHQRMFAEQHMQQRQSQPPPLQAPQSLASPGDAPGIASKGFFPGQAFFNSSNEPPVKRKRGRPRKNPMKEPGAPKRTYNRKKKTAPVIEGNSDSVYNFDEEEQDGLLPMRPRKAPSAQQQQQAKKFPFGTDEEMPKGLKMGGIARGNGNGAPPGPPNHMMGGYAHNSMQMSMPQQQQYMMNQNRHNMNPHMQRQQQQQHMQQQQLPQHQNNMSNENSQDCSYSSEVLKEGVGIKLKIRKEPIKNENSNSNSSFLEQQQQQQMQQQQQNKQDHQLQQQQQQPQAQQHRQSQPQQMLNRHGQQAPYKRSDPASFPGQVQHGNMNYEQMQHQQQQQHQMRMSGSQAPSIPTGPPNSATPSAISSVLGSGNVPSPAMTSPAHPPSSRMHNPGSVESNHTMSPNPMNHQSPYHHMNSPSNPHPGNHQQISSQMHSPSQNSGNFGQVGVSPHSQQHGASGGMSNFSQGQMSHPMQSPYNGMNGTFPNGAPMTSRYRMPGAVPNNYQEMNSETSNASGFYGQQGNNFGNMSMNTMGSNGISGYGAMNHQRFGMSNSQFHGPHNYPQQMRQMGNSYGNEQFGNIYANQGQFPGMGFNNPRMGMGHHQGQGGMIGHGGNMGHNMHHHQFRPNMGMGPGPMNSMGNVGSPRISPNHPNMPMPGVGMPRVSPSMASRQPTPLVSPQSDNSPASHQNPLTPGSYHQPHTPSGPTHYGGPITPASNHNPMTPANSNAPPTHHPHHHHHHHPPGSVSPMTPNNPRTPQNFGGPPSQTPSSMVAPSPKQEPLVSPAPAYDDLASPSSSGASNLRKIRRPSKPNQPDPPSISPRAEIKAEPLPVKVEPSPPKVEPQPPRVEETKTKSEPAAQAPKPKPKQLGPKPQHKYLDIPAPIYEEKKIVVKVKKEIEKSDFVARWSELPPKALRLLFRCGVANEGAIPFLVRVSRVCKSWNKEAMDPTIWTHLDLSSGKMKEKYRNDKKLESFLKKYPNVLELKLTGWKNSVGTSTLKMISMVCPKLISLGLASCFKLSNEDVKLIAESYEKLERIDLSNVSSSSCSSRSAVSSSCLTELVTLVGKRLTHFNISNNKMAGLPFVFKALTSHSSNLEEIDISNITTTSREAIPMNVEKFQKSCPKLRVLNANHTMLNLTENPIKEQIQSPGFPFLQELHIAVDSRGYFEGMDDGQIERILKKSDKLKALDIRGCQHVSDSCLIRLPTWEMEKLVLSGCSAASASSDGLELMVKKWAATLLEMDVSFTPGERTVNFMVDEFADANEFSIKKLNLSGTAIKLKSLTKLLKKCDTLEYINLNSCRGLPRGMKRLHGTREALLKLKDDIEEGKFNEDDSDD